MEALDAQFGGAVDAHRFIGASTTSPVDGPPWGTGKQPSGKPVSCAFGFADAKKCYRASYNLCDYILKVLYILALLYLIASGSEDEESFNIVNDAKFLLPVNKIDFATSKHSSDEDHMQPVDMSLSIKHQLIQQ